MADRNLWPPHRWSVRTRTTAATTCIVAVALAIAAVTLVLVVRSQLTRGVVQASQVRTEDIEGLLEGGAVPSSVAAGDEDDALVQVVNDAGVVVAASRNISGEPPLIGDGIEQSNVRRVPVGEHPFVVTGAQVATRDEVFWVLSGQSLEPVSEVTALLTASLGIGVPILVVLVLVTTWRMTGTALAPVERIRRRVDEVQAADPSQRVPVPDSGDEIARLAQTMNEMLDRVETFQTHQRQFVSDASHELRSPIATIRQLTEVAIAHPDKNDDALLGDVHEESLRMQGLVDDLLLLARGNASPSSGRHNTVDLDDLALAEIDRLRGTTSLGIDGSGVTTARTRGREDQLHRAVRNIIDNAVNHATQTVAISTCTAAGQALLRVDDDGSGIAKSDRDRHAYPVSVEVVRLKRMAIPGLNKIADGSRIPVCRSELLYENHPVTWPRRSRISASTFLMSASISSNGLGGL